MLSVQCGDRIELFYEDTPATPIRATVGRLLSDCEEGMSTEVEDYIACWIAITMDKPNDVDANRDIAWHGLPVQAERPPSDSS